METNRRNASKSTGPVTDAGKERSRRNAVRHGLTAETVIIPLEDAEDYRLFEAAVTADFNPETAIERELVLRLASLLWRLRRAESIETGIFQTATGIAAKDEQTSETARETSRDAETPLRMSGRPIGVSPLLDEVSSNCAQFPRYDELTKTISPAGTDPLPHLANRFLHLAAVDKGAFERLGRYETALWRQVCQTVFMLDVLRRQSLDMKWKQGPYRAGARHRFSPAISPFPRR